LRNNILESGVATVPDIKCARTLARAFDVCAAVAFSPSGSAWSGELSRRFMWLRIQSRATGVASRCVTQRPTPKVDHRGKEHHRSFKLQVENIESQPCPTPRWGHKCGRARIDDPKNAVPDTEYVSQLRVPPTKTVSATCWRNSNCNKLLARSLGIQVQFKRRFRASGKAAINQE
jgi:hypothetical protein